MPTTSLPDHPDLSQLRRRARELQRAAAAGAPEALALLAEQLGSVPAPPVPLHLAQLALARAYGSPSWSRLVTQVRTLDAYRSDPVAAASTQRADPAEGVLRQAVLLFSPEDGPARWSAAADLLTAGAWLRTASVSVAAAAGDIAAVRALLAADPAAASRPAAPFGWPPLLYLTYGRLGLAGVVGDAVTSAELLLDAGADPASGFYWQGLPTPFTALTGVLGSATAEQPAHPDGDRLARLLLSRGADANDAQALYNRMFVPDDDHLVLLLSHGLGTGDGGVWRRRLPDLTDAPAQLLASQLGWAVVHGLLARIRLLAAAGAELVAPLDTGRIPVPSGLTPIALAQRSGRPEVVDLLLELGVPGTAAGDPDASLVAGLVAGDRTSVPVDPRELERLRRRYPSLVLRAAVVDSPAGVRLLVELGFDVDARGRQDLPLEQPWETALHHAAGEGKLELASLLLEQGADPSVRDARYASTPLGWAREFDREALVALLEPVSPAD